MRRLSVIVGLGALLGTFGGVVTASPAFAGRGPKWHLVTAKPFTLPAAFCGFKIRVASPVRMMRPDKPPAAVLSLTHLAACPVVWTHPRGGCPEFRRTSVAGP